MRIFLDTNIWLSGLLGSGLCARLLEELVIQGCDLVISEGVLREFSRIATHKFHIPPQRLGPAMDFMARWTVVPPVEMPLPQCPDEDDRPILASAYQAGCSHFVTGDRALLAMQDLDTLQIVTPRAMLLMLLGDKGL